MNDISPEIKRGPGRPPKFHETVAANVTLAAVPISETDAQSETGATRPARKPFGNLEQKLHYPGRPGFYRHRFNDTAGRIARAIEAGYTHVQDKDGKNVNWIVGTAEGGGPLIAYLMEIPEEYHQADLAAQQEQVNAREAAMRRGELENGNGDKSYIGKQGITIKHGGR